MRRLNSVITMAFACVLLSNCTYFEKAQPSETIDIMAQEQAQAEQAEFQQMTRAREQGAVDFAHRNSGSSSDSIQIQNFESAAPQYRSSQAIPYSPNTGLVTAPVALEALSRQPEYADQSVEIYSLNGVAPAAVSHINNAGSVQLKKPQAHDPFNSARAAKVYFGHGVKTIGPNGQKVLSRLTEEVKDTDHPIRVTGYASQRAETENTVERTSASRQRSMGRALAVTQHLIQKGVPAESIETVSWGEENPAPATDKMDAEAASRRVEITSRYVH